MSIATHSSDLPLADLLQLKGTTRETCCFAVTGAEASGVIFLQGGVAIYAAYGDRSGAEAAYAILKESELGYCVAKTARLPGANMCLAPQALVLEAARRLDERDRRPKDQTTTATHALRAEASEVPPRPATPGPRARWKLWASAALGLSAMAGAVVALVAHSGPTYSAQPEEHFLSQASAAEPVLDASALVEPGDRPPLLAAYAQPASPHPEVPLRPTIPCRLLVDASGTVVKADVYQHRPGFEEYDAAALSAARTYRFEPALRAGAPVAVWMNMPILFQELPRPTYTSLFQ